jgi:phosphate transport system permease protein
MVIGNNPTINASLFAPAYSIAAVIANEFTEATGDMHLQALIELGLVLFLLTILINGLARLVIIATTRKGTARNLVQPDWTKTAGYIGGVVSAVVAVLMAHPTSILEGAKIGAEAGIAGFLAAYLTALLIRLIALLIGYLIAVLSRFLLWRKIVNAVMLSFTGACALFTVSILFFILGYLLYYGGKSLNWAFFVNLPAPVGESGGGMANAIVGSGKLLLLASLVGVPIGLLGGVYLAEFGGRTFSFVVRYTTDLLNGVPSIVMGIFAYTIVVIPMKHFSAFAGGMALGVMMIPIAVRTTEESLRAVPDMLREGALALGASKWKTVATVVMPAAIRGIVTGIMLTLARVAGETAPLLFTAFSNHFWSSGWNQPTDTLPVMIYTYALGPYDDWHRQAWAAGLVLLGFVLIANIGARFVVSGGISFRRA